MTTPQLTEFFLRCTLINGGILILWTIAFVLMPDWIYRVHSHWFKMPRERYDATLFTLLGLFKIGWLLLNLTPYLALRWLPA